MSRHLLVLLFLYGVNNVSGASQETTGDAAKSRIKKDVGANGVEPQAEIFQNFRNPVLEYLMRDNLEGVRKRGVVREIRHSQSLLVPNFFNIPGSLTNALPQLQGGKKPETGTRNPASVANFWNFVKNPKEENKTQDSIVTSQVVQLNKNSTEEKEEEEEEEEEERTTVQVYPALAVAVNTFNKDGSIKKSVVHFQPDFTSVARGSNAKEATPGGSTNRVSDYIKGQKPVGDANKQQPSIPWPFAGVFPIVINDPFLSAYNAFSTSMYNAVSSMIEYGPDADVCRHKKPETEFRKSEKYASEEKTNSDFFGEVTMKSETFKKSNRKQSLRDRLIISDVPAPSRRRRDTTSIHLKSRQGDKVSISLEEPVNLNNRKPEESDLILRKGGIAIAGPGGAATAYTGGTAIVGPYGTVYKSPEGTAILGPFSKIVNITDDMSFEDILKLHKKLQNEELKIRTGPRQSTNFKNFRNFFSYKANLPLKIDVKPQGRNILQNLRNVYRLKEQDVMKTVERLKEEEFKRIVQDAPFEEKMAKENETTLVFRPKSKAEAGRNGVALSAPTSHALLYPGQKTNIFFEPESVASAGPSGFAHAHSDLYVTFVPNTTVLIKPQERKKRSPLLLLLQVL